jgi:hypothetical protein
MLADAASLRKDEHLKDLAQKESLLIVQALRLSELEEKLKAQSSAAAATSIAAFESVLPHMYSVERRITLSVCPCLKIKASQPYSRH